MSKNNAKIKKDFLEALESSYGNIKEGANQVSVTRRTIYNWISDDSEFRDKVESIRYLGRQNLGDLAENALKDRIVSGDTTAIIFTLKSLRKEFYGEYKTRKEGNKLEGLPETKEQRSLLAGLLANHDTYLLTLEHDLSEEEQNVFTKLGKCLYEKNMLLKADVESKQNLDL